VNNKGGSIDIAIHKVSAGEYCLILTPRQEFRAPILATLQGEDSTAGLISVNTAFGSDCNPLGGFGVFTKNPAGTATDHEFVVAIMWAGSVEPGAPARAAAKGCSSFAPDGPDAGQLAR
jgi:hypothetical protein